MRNYFCVFFSAIFLCLAVFDTAYGQTAIDSTGLLQTAVNKTSNIFYEAIGRQSSLYNGPRYYFYNPLKIQGSPYFQETTSVAGNVFYDGLEYNNIQLIYDLYKDDLITVLYDGYSYFSLLKGGVQSFDLLNHHFININADTLINNSVIKAGYYDELYGGRSQVLVKNTKTIKIIQNSTGTLEAYSTFSETDQSFFIRKDNIYYNVNSEGSFLSVFKTKKKQLQSYIRTNKLKFKKEPGQALATIAAYYDSLSN